MNDELAEGRIYATFEKYGELLDIQKILLSLDPSEEPSAEEDRGEDVLLRKLSEILNEYQEQAYLLDPFIEELVTPVVEKLKNHAKASVTSPDGAISGTRVGRIALLLYNYIKFRGYKTITRFFPHEIADLSIALDYVLLLNGNTRGSSQDPSQWSLRYVVLLWLSLICMIPFDLEQFDDRDNIGDTSAKLESLGKSFLSNAGLERDGASILLSRLYMRKDTSAKLLAFLKWSIHTAQCQSDPFSSIGMLQVLCELTKSGSAEKIQAHVILLLDVAVAIKDNATLMANTVVRKLRTKLVSRVVLRRLPAVISAARIKGRALSSRVDPTTESLSRPEDDDFDVPEETESVLEELFEALQDKDTIVRWSAAKGIARISERLPAEFAQQVLDTIIGLFSIHSIAAATIYDMPSIAESTWHGTCLACAEMARRGLVADEKLPELVDWLCKALYFDIRKGAHSVGSNVRDAASYVLWSLARAQSPSALAPHAQNLAQRLVAVSLFDREIHIRRAASATFQEYVGRTSLFPHGIDVLRKTDFYAVGVRRNAFLVAAPEVAEHDDYQSSLIDHLLTITLRHWDPTMRQLGAQSLRAICELDLPHLGPSSAERAAQLLKGSDTGDIHGALLTLTELATAYRDSGPGQDLHAERRKIFAHWSDVPLNIVQSPRHELVTAAACCLIANSISPEEIQLTEGPTPNWRRIVDFGLKSKSAVVQEAAATAMASFSSGSSLMQQSLSRVLGVLDYNAHPHGIQSAVRCLLACVDRSVLAESISIEARRNAFVSMPQIIANVASRLPENLAPLTVCQIVDALYEGLSDYTTDQRGDVGSWVRMTCVQGITSIAEILFKYSQQLPTFSEYFPASKYHDCVGGILKQGVERLDNVRQLAGECFLRLLLLPLPVAPGAEAWRIHGDVFMKGLFLSDSETIGWNESERLFRKAVRLLEIERYRAPILAGLVLSVSSKTDSTQRPVSASLAAYARSLPIATTGTDTYALRDLAQDLLSQAKRNLGSNNIVVPVLQTFNVLLEADAFERLPDDALGLRSLENLLSIASKDVARLKSPQRISVSMRIVVNLLPVGRLRRECIAQLLKFLAHQYPKIRADTAEHLYLVLQSKDLGYDTDEVENILLETEWSSNNMPSIRDAAQRCLTSLLPETQQI